MPKDVFYDPAGGFFSQKKKVVLSNIKYSDNKRDISLIKSGFDNTYLDLDKISIKKTALLAKEKKIIVNVNVKKQKMLSNWAVVIKKIPIDMSKEIIVAAVVKFGEIKSIKIQLIEIWQKTWRIMKLGHPEIGFRILLYILPIGMTAHNFGTLLDRTGEKTCVINCLMESDNQVYYAVIGFESEENLESAYHTELIFGNVNLSWAKLNLVHCEKCEHFGYSALECNEQTASTSKSSKLVKRLAKLYAKKSVPISHFAAFGISFASSSDGFYFSSGSESGFPSYNASNNKECTLVAQESSSINDCLALLKHFLELLADQVSSIMHRLNGVKLVFLVSVSQVDIDMVLNILWPSLSPSSSVIENKIVDLGLNSLKILISKVGSLEFKMITPKVFIGSILRKLDLLDMTNLAKQNNIICWHKNSDNMVSIVTETKLRSNIRPWIINKFDEIQIFTSDLDAGFYDAGVAIIMNNFLA
ncbi:hypothetical protein G9A89_020035 [Geosiphon pyriformis]|nr:hypothetical protein G9A89_020035 [Geosiphon pyriformis]